MERTDQLELPIAEEEFVYPGHTACPGCSAVLAMRLVLKALGPRTIMVIPPGCSGPIAGGFPISALKIPTLRIAFGTTASSASGIRAALNSTGKKNINVLAWAGDGATLDIGLAALSSAAERWPGKRILVVTHGGVIKTLIYRLSGRDFLPGEPPLFQGRQLHWLVHEEGGLRIEKVNALELE